MLFHVLRRPIFFGVPPAISIPGETDKISVKLIVLRLPLLVVQLPLVAPEAPVVYVAWL